MARRESILFQNGFNQQSKPRSHGQAQKEAGKIGIEHGRNETKTGQGEREENSNDYESLGKAKG
jgi:hypothetical protein